MHSSQYYIIIFFSQILSYTTHVFVIFYFLVLMGFFQVLFSIFWYGCIFWLFFTIFLVDFLAACVLDFFCTCFLLVLFSYILIIFFYVFAALYHIIFCFSRSRIFVFLFLCSNNFFFRYLFRMDRGALFANFIFCFLKIVIPKFLVVNKQLSLCKPAAADSDFFRQLTVVEFENFLVKIIIILGLRKIFRYFFSKKNKVILKGSRGVFKSKLFLCSDGFHCLLHNRIFYSKKNFCLKKIKSCTLRERGKMSWWEKSTIFCKKNGRRRGEKKI